VKSGRILGSFFFWGLTICAPANAQNGCGDTLNWTSSTCQVIGAGQLNAAMVDGANDPNAWRVISRHGEYGQNETECNVPSAIRQSSTAPGELIITTSSQAASCGGWNQDGSVRESPTVFPYTTGDLQWNSFNFTYGTVIFRAKVPPSNTNTWPAIWMLAKNCQTSNKYSGDTTSNVSPTDTSSSCPNIGDGTSNGGYHEIDMLECYNSGGWCQFHVANPSFGIGGNCDTNYAVDTNFHTWTVTWAANDIKVAMDGKPENGSGCTQSMRQPMFLMIQTQTGGVGGTPANLPAQFIIDYVKVCNTTDGSCASVANNDSSVIFYDDFNSTGTRPVPPTGLTAVVK
jgi:hypothetical protein